MTARVPRGPTVGAAVAALAAPVAGRALRDVAALQRTNHRGAAVSLATGPALALGVTAGAAAGRGLPARAVAVAVLGAAAVGAYDDAAGTRPGQARDKGFRGHLAALREGRLSAGTVKAVGIGVAGLAAVAALPGRRRPGDVLLGGALVAAAANLLNLLDVRPGRALKAGLAAAVALRCPAVAGAAAALLPGDLGERTMLGDCGANALGAALGLALVDALPRRGQAAALAVLAALTAASEVVSYSAVIDRTPPLRWLDRLGRRP